MERDELPKLNPKSVRWMQKFRDRTDDERSAWAGPRVRRYIDCYDLLRAGRRWFTTVEIREVLQVSPKQTRRTLKHLEAAGVIEVMWGSGRTPGVARIKKDRSE